MRSASVEHLFHAVRDVDDADARRRAAAGRSRTGAPIRPPVSDDVGSSMTRMRASSDKRLGDLDHLHLPGGQRRDERVGAGARKPDALAAAPRLARQVARRGSGREERRVARPSLPRKMLAAMSRFGASISS